MHRQYKEAGTDSFWAKGDWIKLRFRRGRTELTSLSPSNPLLIESSQLTYITPVAAMCQKSRGEVLLLLQVLIILHWGVAGF